MELLVLALVILALMGAYRVSRRRRELKSVFFESVILSPEDLAAHGKELAQFHRTKPGTASSLHRHVRANFRSIRNVYRQLAADLHQGREIAPAGEWLLDNYYVVEEQVQDIIRNLSAQRLGQLPMLTNGSLKGYPRVYALALEVVGHTDGDFDADLLEQFINGYQQVSKLSVGEVWSLSLLSRVALVAKIHYSSQLLVETHRQWRRAEQVVEDEAKAVAEIEQEDELAPSFIQHLTELAGPEQEEIRTVLDDKLWPQDSSLEQIVNQEYQAQAALATAMGNSLTSLKQVGSIDWQTIFETLCPVDQVFEQDAIYGEMDLDSRSYYRYQVQQWAKRAGVSETRVAKLALDLCQDQDGVKAHVGYYLLDAGCRKLARKLGVKWRRRRMSAQAYLLIVGLVTLLISATGAYYAWQQGVTSGLVTLLLLWLPVSEMVVSGINRGLSGLRRPAFLPKLEYRQGVPRDAATLVVVATLLTSAERARELVASLEVHALANPDPNICFALLADFKDAPTQHQSEDEEILAAAQKGIRQLQRKYGMERFHLISRQRSYSQTQGNWMGWERKRGALMELNALLCGSNQTGLSRPKLLPAVRYVLTLDADTRLPLGMAAKLVGTISHPLNQGELVEGKIVRGYGLIQPRIALDVESVNKSPLTRILAGPAGLDTYSTAISNVYQDWFGQGIFAGKGIYDVRVAQALLADVPENSILSHDLLEGGLLKTGLATDLLLVDDFPTTYSAYMQRQHRWIRGDWQLLPWLGKTVPGRNGSLPNALNTLTRWQVFDNLRRSLLPLALIVLLVAGLTVLPGAPWVWALVFVGLLLLPRLLVVAELLVRYVGGAAVGGDARRVMAQLALAFVLLPHQAWVNTDAIVRSLYRLGSRRNLLQWTTAAEAERRKGSKWLGFGPVQVILIAVGLFLILRQHPATVTYLLLLVLWLTAPLMAQRLSRVPKVDNVSIEPQLLRRIARKTWYFYQDLVNQHTCHLPPDNYQVVPANGKDARTSPTNIGFYLLSILAARDFGFISTGEMVARVERCWQSVEKMSKWKGHLYNWYSTDDLALLFPRFVSTVDSGNYAALLVALGQGLREYLQRPLLGGNLHQGLADLGHELSSPPSSVVQWRQLMADLEKTENVCPRTEELLAMINRDLNTYFVNTQQAPDFMEQEQYADLVAALQNLGTASPGQLQRLYEDALAAIEDLDTLDQQQRDYLQVLKEDIVRCQSACHELMHSIRQLTVKMDESVWSMDFSALYNQQRHLFSVGYSVDEEKLMDSCYDLLASEARLTSYLAVVGGQVPARHWFRLGRAMTESNSQRTLVSWAGTMFEYLLPPLLQRSYPNTLLGNSIAGVIAAQRSYGRKRKLPWGISESGYYGFDHRLNYQYKAFGVPGLGLKRGLGEEIVVSPYSTLLALPFAPEWSVANIKSLLELDMEGQYGLYEAVDFTPERVENQGLVKSYMAHHQGMGFIALTNYLHNSVIVQRFHSNPRIKGGELLLQEQVSRRPVLIKKVLQPVLPLKPQVKPRQEVVRTLGVPRTMPPECHLLSNGSYQVLLTASGGGYSRREDTVINRWREELPGHRYGTFLFVRDLDVDVVWSATYAPFNEQPDFYRVRFQEDRASYFRQTGVIDAHTEIIVSSEEGAEIRQLTLTNHGDQAARLEVTSFLELALSQGEADVAHPAFNKLFVQTESVKELNCLLAARRPRQVRDSAPQALHMLYVVKGDVVGSTQWETDRAKFIGRGRDITTAVGLDHPLTNSTGAVLDPVFSLRQQVTVPPGDSCVLNFVTAQSESRDGLLAIAKKFRAPGAGRRAMDLSHARAKIETKYLNMDPKDVEASQQALAHLLFLSPTRGQKPAPAGLGQAGLWSLGISGDNPLVLVPVEDGQEIGIVEQAVQAHSYWRFKGFKVDLVILNREQGGYLQSLDQAVGEVVRRHRAEAWLDQPGGIFVRNRQQLSTQQVRLLLAVARLVLQGGKTLAEQLAKAEPLPPRGAGSRESVAEQPTEQLEPPTDLQFFNGYGGFSQDGREYVLWLGDKPTPAPWSNVLANEHFGTLVTESGGGYTFAENSRENKITPWSNDPISDPPGELIYLQDETRDVWAATPAPGQGVQPFMVTHGWGYSKFTQIRRGIHQQMTVFVPREDPVKISLLKLDNLTENQRQLTLTYYIRPVLGVSEESSQQHLVTRREGDVVTISNPYNSDFRHRVVWLGASEPVRSVTGDRMEFVGLKGDLIDPMALKGDKLRNSLGAGLDPCAVIQFDITLQPREQREVVLQLGQGRDLAAVKKLAEKYTVPAVKDALVTITDYWRRRLETVVVKTPDAAFNVILPWLAYQTWACRLWARTGFYQSGGAFGFRDQLQDAMNMVLLDPNITRQQILLHAAHQFQQGDVQHWWHPGTNNRGVRTRFSDDLLWLPYATILYIQRTGDMAILDESIPFLEAEPLAEGEDERYGPAEVSWEKADLYEHCLRAIQRSLPTGSHGLPLMGSGDWNDGMSTVGNKGKGESVWLGWFLYSVLQGFAPLCRARNDHGRTEFYVNHAKKLAQALDKQGWDGRWYRRAYFDDGTPLGSAENDECSIDAIAQSWAVISGAGQRGEQAMAAVEDYLVKDEEGLILLFTPPFADSDLEPGYIKGYLPGVRENGAQYTHASCWVVQATAMLGKGERAHQLFQLLNPINHSGSMRECSQYKTEPYVLAADVYSHLPHTGRGGWTWYTGAAGWLYRVGIENILGLRRQGNTLSFQPCVPPQWQQYQVEYRFGQTAYQITVTNPLEVSSNVSQIKVDGQVVDTVELVDDEQNHKVEVMLGG